jgi:hypothetical protein
MFELPQLKDLISSEEKAFFSQLGFDSRFAFLLSITDADTFLQGWSVCILKVDNFNTWYAKSEVHFILCLLLFSLLQQF